MMISMDGWIVNADPILGFCIFSDGKTYVLDCINTTGESQTSEYLARKAETQIMICESLTNAKLWAW